MWASGNDSPQLDSSFYSGATDDIKNASGTEVDPVLLQSL